MNFDQHSRFSQARYGAARTLALTHSSCWTANVPHPGATSPKFLLESQWGNWSYLRASPAPPSLPCVPSPCTSLPLPSILKLLALPPVPLPTESLTLLLFVQSLQTDAVSVRPTNTDWAPALCRDLL